VLYWVDSSKDTVESAGFNGNNRRVVVFQAGNTFFDIAVFDVSIILFCFKLKNCLKFAHSNRMIKYILTD